MSDDSAQSPKGVDISLEGKKYWLVGASDGLGRALAQQLSRFGVELVLSSRSQEPLEALANELPGHQSVVPVDISSDESVANAAAQIGQIDGVILVAGVYWPFSAKEWNAEQAVQMADTNFTGYMRVLGQVMPGFVEKDDGHVLITSSLSAFRGLPGSVGYTPTKAAALSLAESMYADLQNTGIRVQVVNPGFIRTRLTDKNEFKMRALMEPEEAAREIVEHMHSGAFKKSYPAGFSLIFRAAQFLPDWLYFKLFGK